MTLALVMTLAASCLSTGIVTTNGRLRTDGNRIVGEHGESVAVAGLSHFWSQRAGDSSPARPSTGSHPTGMPHSTTLARAALGVHAGKLRYQQQPARKTAKINSRLVVCTVGNAPHPLITALTELPLERGKLIVEPTGRVPDIAGLWATGDGCAFPKANGGNCPETAQFAMRQGALVGANIAAHFAARALKPFRFTGLGELATIGHRRAVAQVFGLRFSGIIAWFMWRSIYLAKLPGLDRKLRVMAEWTFELFFPRDINLLTPNATSALDSMHLEPGDSLFRAGEPAQSLYAVKTGQIDITDGNGVLVKSAGPGEHFGERALLGDGMWRFDATARVPSKLVAIDGETFQIIAQSIGSLDALFRNSAQQYQLPEEIQKTVATMPEATRSACVCDVMTTAITVLAASASVQDAVITFQAEPHSTYPVIDDGEVIGLLHRSVAYEWLKNHGLNCEDPISALPLAVPLCVNATTPVPELVQTLMRSGVSKAVVVDEQNHLQGMVTLFDLLKRTQSG